MRSTHQAVIESRAEQYLKCISDAYIKSDIRDVLPTGCDYTKIYLLTFAPALISYVSWVLKEAVQSKKKRLYFLSRDGYQMYLIAKEIVNVVDSINREADSTTRNSSIKRLNVLVREAFGLRD